MQLISFYCLALCIVGINCFGLGLDDTHESRGIFHEAAAEIVCTPAKLLQEAGWLQADGKPSRQFFESEAAKECRDLVGNDPCDSADRILSCLRNKGLISAIGILTSSTNNANGAPRLPGF